MSGRAVRKFLKKTGHDDLLANAARIESRLSKSGQDGGGRDDSGGPKDSDDSESQDEQQIISKPFNAFALLQQADGEAEEDQFYSDRDLESNDDDDEGGGGEQTKDEMKTIRDQSATQAKKKPAKGKKNKKKGKRNNQGKGSANVDQTGGDSETGSKSSPFSQAPGSGADSKSTTGRRKSKKRNQHWPTKDVSEMTVKEFEAQLREITAKFGDVGLDAGINGGKTLKDQDRWEATRTLIATDARHLDPEREMQRLFGSRAVSDIAKKRIPARRFRKRFVLTQPAATWPPMARSTGLQMERCPDIDDESGATWFKFVHTPKYQETQYQFLRAVASHDPNTIANMVYTNPLDPTNDPTGALLVHDFLAIKARRYDYLLQFIDAWVGSSLDTPNWAYSKALAKFMLEGSGVGLASHEESLELLTQAILVYPSAIVPLSERAALDIDPRLAGHPYFEPQIVPNSKSQTWMQLAVGLFTEYNSSLYKIPEVASWLREGVRRSLALIDANVETNEWVQRSRDVSRRLCTYDVPENVSRHVLISGVSGLTSGLPTDIREATQFDFDPLPPSNDVNMYSGFYADLGVLDMNSLLRQLTMNEIPVNEVPGVVRRFLQRLVPWARQEMAGHGGDGDETSSSPSEDEQASGEGRDQVRHPENVGPVQQTRRQHGDGEREDILVRFGEAEGEQGFPVTMPGAFQWLAADHMQQQQEAEQRDLSDGEISEAEREWMEAFDAVERAEAEAEERRNDEVSTDDGASGNSNRGGSDNGQRR
ncbi:Transcription factor 25 [Spiromyces aspiralis]|uniref:Transcription factor 25 n=1 Tax=Spiromyces aspiralis TaxID=68401 RepID=A0ACC1I0X0_9FUNG|nr:Transcription factor 25 [Spiromyces aspiralis]